MARLQPIKNCLLAILMSGLVTLVCHPSISAHARLDSSSPVSGSTLKSAPSEISLTFTERVADGSLSISLTLPDGAVQSLSPNADSDNQFVASVPQTSQAEIGNWVVRWKALSADDGHWSDGLIAFSVGTGRPPAGSIQSGGSDRSWSAIVERAVLLLLLAFVGATALGLPPIHRHLALPTRVLVAVFILGVSLVQVWGHPGLTSSRYLVGAGVAGAMAALAGILPQRLRVGIMCLLMAAVSLLLSLAGHGNGQANSGWLVTANAIHILIALCWLGYVLHLAIDSDRIPAELALLKIGAVLLAGVALIAATGVLFAVKIVPGEQALRTTTYGQTLLLKQIAVLAAIAFGATNLIATRPWFRHRIAFAGIQRQAAWVARAEACVLSVAVIFGAALAQTAPPPSKVVTVVAAPVRTLDTAVTAGALTLHITATIASTADDVITLVISDSASDTPTAADRVIVQGSNSATSDAVRFDATQDPNASDTWQFSALQLPIPAIWSLEVIVRRSGQLDSVTPVNIDSSAWLAEQPRLTDRSWNPINIPAGAIALLVLAVLIPVGGLFLIRHHGQIQPAMGAVIIVALVAIAAGFAIQSWQRTSVRTPDHALTMPAATDTVAASTTWAALCAACHGPTGEGLDEASPNHQHGSGTSLIDAATTRRSDGDLYWVLSNGLGGTDMPAFDIALNDQQRWGLIGWIRQAQQNSPAEP